MTKTIILTLLTFFMLTAHASPAGRHIAICYNYSCKQQADVAVSEADVSALRKLLGVPAGSAARERQRIATAIAFFELLAGQQTPVFRDRGGNPYDGVFPGQLDCIDESRNTDAYLHFMASLGLLHWHKVGQRTMRSPFLFDVHWAATIVDKQTGITYAVDSWPRDNGQPPVIQELGRWLSKAPVDP